MSPDLPNGPVRARTISLIYQYRSWRLAHVFINILTWNQDSMWQERQLSLIIIHRFYFHLLFYLKILSRPFNNQHCGAFMVIGRHEVNNMGQETYSHKAYLPSARSTKVCSAFSLQLAQCKHLGIYDFTAWNLQAYIEVLPRKMGNDDEGLQRKASFRRTWQGCSQELNVRWTNSTNSVGWQSILITWWECGDQRLAGT